MSIFSTPIQPTASGMDPIELKKRFGRKRVFHGGIDVQTLLPFGKPEEIRREVHRRISILAENGGSAVAPSHNIQANTNVENILAFYEAVRECSNEE